jgi:GxxExxY protein
MTNQYDLLNTEYTEICSENTELYTPEFQLINNITQQVIGIAMKVHSELGPGLLENAYKECLIYDLAKSGLYIQREIAIPLVYKGIKLECGYRADIIVENKVIIEIKAVETLNDVHLAQLLTYLKIANKKLGLLMNFNVARLKDGIRRVIL